MHKQSLDVSLTIYLFLMQHLVLEPFSDWLVMEFQTGPCQENGEEDYTHIQRDVHPNGGIRIALHPSHLHIHHGIMSDIKRI